MLSLYQILVFHEWNETCFPPEKLVVPREALVAGFKPSKARVRVEWSFSGQIRRFFHLDNFHNPSACYPTWDILSATVQPYLLCCWVANWDNQRSRVCSSRCGRRRNFIRSALTGRARGREKGEGRYGSLRFTRDFTQPACVSCSVNKVGDWLKAADLVTARSEFSLLTGQ